MDELGREPWVWVMLTVAFGFCIQVLDNSNIGL